MERLKLSDELTTSESIEYVSAYGGKCPKCGQIGFIHVKTNLCTKCNWSRSEKNVVPGSRSEERKEGETKEINATGPANAKQDKESEDEIGEQTIDL
jgi:ribosomal protein L37E